MSDYAIQVESTSKLYQLGATERYRTLRDAIADIFSNPFRRDAPHEEPEALWALKDVSFEVERGAVIGIIGRNGAGKSTLLKILSRITAPTAGYVEIRGRVGSLLEVGTGFHPELSGRENIFLNGAILGMRKAEIARKFDEIVAFAELDRFIDTPVKHYSSGMYVRLAFAVAAHLETEILLVDEVLAVGDIEFQNKCLGKIGDVARGGRTVILVSHSMASISSLCSKGLYLSSGRLTYYGPVEEAIERYLSSATTHASQVDLEEGSDGRGGSGELRFISARVLGHSGTPSSQFTHGQDISIEFALQGTANRSRYLAVVLIRTLTGTTVLHVPTPPEFDWSALQDPGIFTIRCRLPDCRLYPGTYIVSLWLGRNAHLLVDYAYDALTFSVESGSLARYGFDMSWRHGLYFCDSSWSIIDSGRRVADPDPPRREALQGIE